MPRRAGTFAYLPPLTREEIARQIEYILRQGWIPGVEYAREEEVDDDFRRWWKLPLFNARSVDEVMAEVEACRQAHPDCYIFVTGYNPQQQHLKLDFVAYYPAGQERE